MDLPSIETLLKLEKWLRNHFHSLPMHEMTYKLRLLVELTKRKSIFFFVIRVVLASEYRFFKKIPNLPGTLVQFPCKLGLNIEPLYLESINSISFSPHNEVVRKSLPSYSRHQKYTQITKGCPNNCYFLDSDILRMWWYFEHISVFYQDRPKKKRSNYFSFYVHYYDMITLSKRFGIVYYPIVGEW